MAQMRPQARVDLSFVSLPDGQIRVYRREQKRGWRILVSLQADGGPLSYRIDDLDGTGRVSCLLDGPPVRSGDGTPPSGLDEDALPALPDGATGLTQRELQVVELAVLGLTAREIGRRLFISTRTVETHLAHAYGKLGVRSRLQLARSAFPRPAGSAWERNAASDLGLL